MTLTHAVMLTKKIYSFDVGLKSKKDFVKCFRNNLKACGCTSTFANLCKKKNKLQESFKVCECVEKICSCATKWNLCLNYINSEVTQMLGFGFVNMRLQMIQAV